MSLFADPYLFYCGNDEGQRALMRELQGAARYAQQRGVLLVTSAGNEQIDLRHPIEDTISPDGPDVIAAAVGLSRVYLRAHYISDVVGGWALGAALFAACGTVALVISYVRNNAMGRMPAADPSR